MNKLLLLKKIDKMCEHLALIKKHFPVPKRYLRDGQKTGPEGYFGRFTWCHVRHIGDP